MLECAWPAALEVAAEPLDSTTWQAALQVVLDRVTDGDLTGLRRRMRCSRFQTAVRAAVTGLGGQRVCWRIARGVYDALDDDTGVPAQRHGILDRLSLVVADWHHTRDLQADVEARMIGVLDDLELTDLVCSLDGLSAVGAATILAETGDLARYASARAVVKHAGLCPRENRSGKFRGDTKISGRGRPSLRLAAWRAVWGALPNNAVLAARHRHLITRDRNRLTGNQARAAVAGSLLRQLHAVVTRRQPWNPQTAAGHHAAQEVMPPAA